jgi:hypothetical protein
MCVVLNVEIFVRHDSCKSGFLLAIYNLILVGVGILCSIQLRAFSSCIFTSRYPFVILLNYVSSLPYRNHELFSCTPL